MLSVTVNEAIMLTLIDADGVDATNLVPVFRKCQRVVADHPAVNLTTVPTFDTQLSITFIDGIIHDLTENGRKPLWA